MIADNRKRLSALRGFAVAKKFSNSSKPSVCPTAFFCNDVSASNRSLRTGAQLERCDIINP